jgi:hypothetical protein
VAAGRLQDRNAERLEPLAEAPDLPNAQVEVVLTRTVLKPSASALRSLPASPPYVGWPSVMIW